MSDTGHPSQPGPSSEPSAGGESSHRWAACEEVEVLAADGLHIRPCSLIARVAASAPEPVTLVVGDSEVEASSIFELMALGLEQGTAVMVAARDASAAEAVSQIAELFRADFPADEPLDVGDPEIS